MEDVGLFFIHLVYFCGYLVYFSRFGTLYQEKSGNPGFKDLVKEDITGDPATVRILFRVAFDPVGEPVLTVRLIAPALSGGPVVKRKVIWGQVWTWGEVTVRFKIKCFISIWH
jgi:hypothetical protein